MSRKRHALKCKTNLHQPCNCDSYHTFDELYEHRIRLFITLCETVRFKSWYSLLHSDGTSFDGWFILGINKEKGKQITYHLPIKYLGEVMDFAEKLESAPEFDGHDSEDVLSRLLTLNDYEKN